MINETVPVYLLGRYGTVTNVLTALGYFLVFFFGIGLPAADYNPKLMDDTNNMEALKANKDDNFWRLMYLFPMMINCIMILNFMLFIKTDPIMFNISHDRDDEALELIDRVYDKTEDRHVILDKLKMQCQARSADGTPFFEALCGHKYWKATLIGAGFTTFV